MLQRLRRCAMFCLFLLMSLPPVMPQTVLQEGQQGEPFTFVGMTLPDLFLRFGPPQSVYTARGQEHWQDDVVFTYSEGDFYVYRDRVWQVGLKSAYGMKIGDIKAVAILLFGENARDEGDYILYSFPSSNWPVSLRVNFTDNKVSAIFLYRPDY